MKYLARLHRQESADPRAEETAFQRLLGGKIRAAREKMGCSTSDLARYLRVSLPTLSRLEQGQTAWSVYRLMKVAEMLGQSMESLVP